MRASCARGACLLSAPQMPASPHEEPKVGRAAVGRPLQHQRRRQLQGHSHHARSLVADRDWQVPGARRVTVGPSARLRPGYAAARGRGRCGGKGFQVVCVFGGGPEVQACGGGHAAASLQVVPCAEAVPRTASAAWVARGDVGGRARAAAPPPTHPRTLFAPCLHQCTHTHTSSKRSCQVTHASSPALGVLGTSQLPAQAGVRLGGLQAHPRLLEGAHLRRGGRAKTGVRPMQLRRGRCSLGSLAPHLHRRRSGMRCETKVERGAPAPSPRAVEGPSATRSTSAPQIPIRFTCTTLAWSSQRRQVEARHANRTSLPLPPSTLHS